jgi:hypothetical protein
MKSADSREAAEKIHGGEFDVCPDSISPNGTLLVFREHLPETKNDIWLMSLENDKLRLRQAKANKKRIQLVPERVEPYCNCLKIAMISMKRGVL